LNLEKNQIWKRQPINNERGGFLMAQLHLTDSTIFRSC